jgi:hypothetical protein
MAHHPFGIALYRPLPSDSFKPGACGYFDEFGHWNPICDVEDSISLEIKGLNLLEDPIERAPLDQGITWAAKLSVNMRGIKIPLKAGMWGHIPVFSFMTDSELLTVILHLASLSLCPVSTSIRATKTKALFF